MARLGELGEDEVVRLIGEALDYPGDALLAYGDDASGLSVEGLPVLVKADGVSLRWSMLPWNTMYDVGWKAVTMVASDIVAKSGRPLMFMVSVGLPPDMEARELVSLIKGASDSARLHGGWLLGGDTNESREAWISSFGVGVCVARPPGRGGARPGDLVLVTGPFGATGAGFHAYYNRVSPERLDRRVWDRLVEATRRPVAAMRFLRLFEEGVHVTSSIDSSDGLAVCLYELSRGSGYAIKVTRLPVAEEARSYSEAVGAPLEDLVFYGGEEFEVVFTVSPQHARRALEVLGEGAMVIGEVLSEPGPLVYYEGRVLEEGGWKHFRRTRWVGRGESAHTRRVH